MVVEGCVISHTDLHILTQSHIKVGRRVREFPSLTYSAATATAPRQAWSGRVESPPPKTHLVDSHIVGIKTPFDLMGRYATNLFTVYVP
jgi:hypothetical protein